jgi:hypothetical protein
MSARQFLQNSWHSIANVVTAAAIACAFPVMLLGVPQHMIVMATG